MGLPYTSPKWATGNYALANPVGLPAFSAPIPATTTQCVLRQKFQQFKNQFSALALNTAHPDYATFYLVAEGELFDLGGGVVEWERTYAAVPASYDEFESFAYSFIGFMGTVMNYSGFGGGVFNAMVVTGRVPQAFVLNSRVHHDYFMVGAGLTYTTAGAIPSVLATRYYAPVLYGGTPEICLYLWDTFGAIAATNPSRTTYNGWVTDATSNQWAATTGQLVAEDSRLTRWWGNIWLRETRYVLAR
jgi:hypothetical protein